MALSDTITIEDFAKLDIRIGTITTIISRTAAVRGSCWVGR